MKASYGCFSVRIDGPVANVTIDNPPDNVMDFAMIAALAELVEDLERASELSVVVFRSADEDFFIMHFDVHALAGVEAHPFEPQPEANGAARTLQRLHVLPQVTIGVLEGYARGGGAEFLGSLDLRFASTASVIAQPEVPLGIIPGGTGTTRLPHHVGRSKALDYILTGRDVPAEEACASGWLTKVAAADELDAMVSGYVELLARMPRAAIAAAKRVVDASLGSIEPILVIETNAMGELMSSGEHVEPMRGFLERGGQTREGEARELRW